LIWSDNDGGLTEDWSRRARRLSLICKCLSARRNPSVPADRCAHEIRWLFDTFRWRSRQLKRKTLGRLHRSRYHLAWDVASSGILIQIRARLDLQMITCNTLSGHPHRVAASELVFRPSVYALIPSEGRIVLVTMQSTGQYGLPGGAVELGERREAALMREVREETGLQVTVGRLLPDVLPRR
jgi:hypothetical protein